MAKLEISLFGPFQVLLNGAPITAFESVKVRALLAYLAAEADRSHRREALATLLWPDWPQQSAMRNLRNALMNLRKNIGDREAQPPFLLITRESIQLNREAEVWVDVGEYEQKTRSKGEEIGDQQSTIKNLQSAISLYRGSFLEGFSLPDSPAFEQWVLARREGLNRQALQALFALAEAHEQQGELEKAIPYARRQVELEPWHEPGQQQLMRLLALSCQRSAALAQYEACRQALADELEVEPSAETKRLVEAIRNEDIEAIRDMGIGVAHTPFPLSPVPLPPAPGEPPFKGLQYFDVGDADLFFGREALTARLVGHIRQMVEAGVGTGGIVGATHPSPDETTVGKTVAPNQTRVGNDGSPLPLGRDDGSEGCCFLAVVGASGSGKSSVVRAGVVPALQRSQPLADGTLPPEGSPGWHIHVFTPTAHPLESLAVSLMRETRSVGETAQLIDDLAREPRSLHLYAQHLLAPQSPGLAGKCRLLLMVDQFEELFTLCRSEAERTAFLDNLLTAVKGGGPTQVVVVLRADFYGHCAQYPLLRQALCSRQEYIGPMEAAELRRAIEEPAKRNGWEFEAGLVDLILRDIGASEGHAPEPGALPLLEHALLELWQRRSGRTMTLKGYAEAGGVHGAIAKTAESVFARLTPEQQALTRRIFLRLTELGEGTQDTRRRARLDELAPSAQDASIVSSLLKTLADARLITLAEDSAEVAHEALIREWPALREWLSADREGLRLHRHLTDSAEAWAELERDAGELYRGARLAQAAEWADGHAEDLNTLEREYLQASQAQAEREATEREAQRQRELEAAQRLARTQRQRSLALSIGLAIAVVLIGVALWLNFRANQAQRSARTEANNRATQQSMAEQAQSTAQVEVQRRGTAEAQALEQKDLALQNLNKSEAQRLAAIANRLLIEGSDSQIAALLALRSLDFQYTTQGDEALSRASRQVFPLRVFHGGITSIGIAFTGDGKKILINSADGPRLWDVASGQPLQTFRAVNPSASVDISADGRYVAGLIFSAENALVVWDGSTGRELFRMTDKIILTDTQGISITVSQGITSTSGIYLDLSSDGKYLLVGHADESVRMWEIATGKEIHRFPGHLGGPVAMVFSPDDRYVLTSDGGFYPGGITKVRLWDARSGELLHVFAQHHDWVMGLAISPDDKIILTTSFDKTGCFWDLASGQLLRCIQSDAPFFEKSTFSPDGRYALTGDRVGIVGLWEVSTGTEIRSYKQSQGISGLAFSPDGKMVATVDGSGTAFLWAVEPNLVQKEFIEPGSYTYSAVFSPDGRSVAAAEGDGKVRVWDVNTGQETSAFNAMANSVNFSADGKVLFASSNEFFTWDNSTGITLSRSTLPTGAGNWAMMSPDGKSLVAIQGEQNAEMIDAMSGKILKQFPEHPYGATIAFSSDGSRVALGTWRDKEHPAQVLIFSYPGLEQLMAFDYASDTEGGYMAFSPDGRSLLASGAGGENALILWDTVTGEKLQQFPTGPAVIINGVAFSPDGRYVGAAISGSENTVTMWEVATGREVRRFTGHTQIVASVDFSSDGKWVATSSLDGTVKLWYVDLEELKSAMCAALPRDLTAEERATYGITDPGPTCPKFAQAGSGAP